MTESKKSQGLATVSRAAARAGRKVIDLGDAIVGKKPASVIPDDKPDRKQLTGRAAMRASKRGTGYEKPWRSRMQRQHRKRRTGGVR